METLLETVQNELSDEDVAIHEWRAERLAHLGISTIVAQAVASFVDWHEVARLVERGCAPELALEIVR
jgi:16S rRNA G527 N7-methylase RsmG